MNTSKVSKMLVTGLSGLVGSRFSSLYGDKYELINLDLTSGIDITDAVSVEKAFADNPDSSGIIHLAAFTNLNAAQEQAEDKAGICYRVNVLGTKVIAEAAAKYDKYMIHVSTDYVFDGEKTEPYLESDTPNPIEWYGKTKYLAEKEVEASGANYVILRLAFPYQAKPMRPDLIAKIRTGFEQHSLTPLFNDHFITPTLVDNVTQVFDYVAENQPSGIYHMTGSSSHSDFEIGQMVKQIFGYEDDVKAGSLTEYLKANPRPYQRNMRISNQKLINDFGIKMATLEEGLLEIKKQL